MSILGACTSARLSGARSWTLRSAHNVTSLRSFSSTIQCRSALLRHSKFPPLPGRAGVLLGSASRTYFWSPKPAPGGPISSEPPVSQSIPEEAATTPIADSAAGLDSSVTAAAESIPSSSIDVVSSLTDPSLTDTLITNASSIPPLEFGDLSALGLVSWYSPAGIIRESFEIINVATGMPWFWTIIVGTVFWRIAVAPFVIDSLRNSAKLLPMTPRLLALRDEMKAVNASGDKLALQRVALKQKKVYEDAGVSMGRMAITPFIQLPVSLGLFFGIKKMCEHPVLQLKDSGVSFLTDLTVADPTYILPVLSMAAINLQISLGAREMNMAERPEMGHLMNGLRILTFMGAYVMASFPAGLMLSLLVTSTATIIQSLCLQSPAIRAALKVPIVPKHLQGRVPSFKQSIKWVKDYWNNKIEDAQRQAVLDQKARMRHRR